MSLLPAAVLVVTLVVVSATDLKRRVIPNRVLLPAAAVGVTASALTGPEALLSDLAAAAAISLPLFAASLIRPDGMGMGDAKLVAVLGLFLGWQALPALLIGLVLAGMTGVMIALGRRMPPSRTALPLAPFLAAGALPVMVANL